VIDASHDNSGKDHERQPEVVNEISDQVAGGNGAIVGVMMESFLVGGRQDLESKDPLVYGQSITDACMDWDHTVLTLDRLASAVQKRREAA
jgi:3-deoxy-7-phosphoheptulonate synthase